MTPELTQIAKRLARCPKWQFLPGMLVVADGEGGLPRVRPGDRVRLSGPASLSDGVSEGYFRGWHYPDLDDLVTRDAVPGVVRRARGEPYGHAIVDDWSAAGTILAWGWRPGGMLFGQSVVWGDTEEEVLLLALKGAR